MPTNRKRRTRKIVTYVLTDSVKHYLMTGDYCSRTLFPDCPGRYETFLLAHPGKREQLREVWMLHRDDILQQWKAEKRRGKPWASKQFDKKGEKTNERA